MAEALAADIKENILTCSICRDEFEDPRVLPCFHTFCYGCICDHATRTLTPNRTFMCPVCREEIQFPASGLHQLKKNFVFSKTKDIITKQQERQTLEEEQANVAAVTQAIAQMTISCEKHPNNELKYYCGDDNTVICVNSAYDNWKKQKEATKGIIEFHHATLHSACDFAQELITNGTDSEIMLHAKPLILRLAVMEKTPVPTPDTPAQISYIPGKIYTARLKAMLGQVTEELQLPLPGQGTNPRSAPNLPVFFEKVKCTHSFCTLKGDIILRIYGLAVDEQYTYVVDQYNSWLWNARTKLFTHDGELKFDFKLNNPFDVAVSQTGHLYITSRVDKCVKVYSTRGKQVTTMGRGILEAPCGITVNRQGHAMVCDEEKKFIFTFHPDSGQLLNTIPLRMCKNPVYITVNSLNDSIVILDIDCVKSCVHVLSPTGNQLYQYQYGEKGSDGSGDGQLGGLCGVCTDSYGQIFIADTINHRIVVLSPQGQFIRYIATEDDGLEHPIALAINPAGQLVVAEEDGMVKTFQYL
ncbi:tripartite motif-containing protein 2-like [Lingula anatina]|uniref:Tripartite motif-containing protein 2-like n=1 Tax=Lingula anatina TaxID=7574 RepID=A0A1S3H4X5_LINAN|nr:tripartite motif-containing protein 2-like [Lingula anatina]|eukprot:XP_013381058.1 tripartite motif-containing protein 2-like [Lingula anatina]